MEVRSAINSDPGSSLNSVRLAARLADPAMESCAPVTFPLDPRLGSAALAWRRDLYLPEIAPRFQEALGLARTGRAIELAGLDVVFSAALPSRASAASKLAGRRLADTLAQPKAARVMKKFVGLVDAGRADGHLISYFALRCAEFSIPDRQAHAAYIYLEVLASGSDPHPAAFADFLASTLDALPETFFQLRAA